MKGTLEIARTTKIEADTNPYDSKRTPYNQSRKPFKISRHRPIRSAREFRYIQESSEGGVHLPEYQLDEK